MQHLSGRTRKASYSVTGNVVWLTPPARSRVRPCADPLASLKQSVVRLAGEIEKSKKLQAEIAAAVDARRYELYKQSTTLGTHASGRALAAAERIHVGRLLKFVRAVTVAGRDQRTRTGEPAARLELTLREFEASVRYTQQLSRDVLAQCQRRDWRGDR